MNAQLLAKTIEASLLRGLLLLKASGLDDGLLGLYAAGLNVKPATDAQDKINAALRDFCRERANNLAMALGDDEEPITECSETPT